MPMDGTPNGWNRPKWIVLGSSLACAAAALTLRHYAPGSLHLPPCPFHHVTGLCCPGCGSTRALHHLLNFEWTAALHCNALTVILLPYLVLFFSLKGMRT